MLKSAFPLDDPSVERTFKGHKDGVTALSFRPDTKQLASASLDNTVMLWNYKAGLRAFRFVGHTGPVCSVDFAPSGALLASASRDKTVRLWTPNVKGDVTVFKAHTAAVRRVQFSPGNEYLATCSDDKTIKIWTVRRTKFQHTLSGHLNWVRSAQFSPDGRLIVSGSDDKTVKLWDLRSRSAMQTYYDHSGIVTSVAFHPTGNIVASGSNDRAVNLWDLRTHKLIQHYGDTHGTGSSNPGIEGNIGSGGVNSVAFGGPAGEYLISTGGDSLVKIYDLKEGHLIFTLHAHSAATTTAVFSPYGDGFATGGMDSTVLSWKTNWDSALECPAPRHGEAYDSHTAADDGRSARRSGQVVPVPLRSCDGPPRSKSKRSQSPFRRRPAAFESGSADRHAGSRTVTGSVGVKDVVTDRTTSGKIYNVGETFFPNERREHAIGEHTDPHSSAHIARPQSAERAGSFKEAAGNRPSSGAAQSSHEAGDADADLGLSPGAVEAMTAAAAPRTAPLEIHPFSDQLSATLTQIVSQLDVLTKTMHIFESRLTLNEDRVAQALEEVARSRSGIAGGSRRPAQEADGADDDYLENALRVEDEDAAAGTYTTNLPAGDVPYRGWVSPEEEQEEEVAFANASTRVRDFRA